ncbi:MAG: signal peptidase I [Actinobacteria bacterium]|nr:signal peptidase I [Actinomycetota bacterium]
MIQINEGRPWLAVVFTLIMQGLGHVYCGRLARGLVFNFLNILPIPIVIALFLVNTSPILMPITIALIIISAIIQLIAIIDSAYIAKHTKADYELKDYNRWYVYVLLVLIVSGGSIGSALYLRDQLLEAFRVPSISSYPTIAYNDRILANKIVYKTKDPARGDLVVFINPKNRHQNYIKRIVAVAGDTVEIKDNQVYINGKKLRQQIIRQSASENIKVSVNGKPLEGDIFYETNGDARYKIILAQNPDNPASDFAKITIPEYHCFVLGDNRNFSLDSRHFGPILLATIKGRADYLYWPAKGWSRFGKLGPEHLPDNEK